ncbi:MAG: SDR family oxidoreductase [Candidatus Promineifilaceae bacterium]|nr:SDR family oxidoreductase [Candidatus Promineifilaceae bacterium]
MQLTVFGATGRTGRHLVEQALAAGHTVQALARNPAKIQVQNDRLTVIQGNVQEADAVQEAIAGSEAVISVLGPTSNTPDYQITKGMKHILEAMNQHEVERLIISVGAGVRDPQDQPGLLDKVIGAAVKLFSKHVYQDMVQVDQLVRQSGLDWTIVRVPMLTDGPAGEQLRVGYIGQGTGPRLARTDMAAFMLAQLEDDRYLHQAPVISN